MDGIKFSNTYFFEMQLGWKGICIEPVPRHYQKLIKNRTCSCYNVCAYNSVGTKEFINIEGYGEGLSGIVGEYDARHTERLEREIKEHDSKKNMITVKTDTLANIFEKEGISEVDFMTVDTEGSELAVLEGIDFSKVSIRFILVEENYPDDRRVEKFLISKKYRRLDKVGADVVYESL